MIKSGRLFIMYDQFPQTIVSSSKKVPTLNYCQYKTRTRCCNYLAPINEVSISLLYHLQMISHLTEYFRVI